MYHIYEIYLLPIICILNSLHFLSAKFNNRSWMSEAMYLYVCTCTCTCTCTSHGVEYNTYKEKDVKKTAIVPRVGLGAQCMK